MKKVILIIAGALCLGAAAVQAQDPTQQPTKDTTSIQPSTPQAEPAYRKDMVKIQATEVPDALKTSLERPQFKGWENGEVFTNTDKTVFIVEIKDEVENRIKVYRFDAEGKPIKDN